MRFTITIDGRTPPELRWGVYGAREVLEQAERLVLRGTKNVKITTENGRAFDVEEFRRF